MQHKLQTYLVGGAIRDRLLGIPVKDHDYVVVGSTPEQMVALGFKQVGADFPVFLHPDTHEEYALARTERKTGPGYHGFSVNFSPDVSIEEDLQRRDLTINALAEDESGTVIDPGNGLADLRDKKLRHVCEAFREDPVRILRTARFAARFHHLGFKIAAETKSLMATMVACGEASHLVPERVWQEWQAALEGNDPQIFVQVLRECGALAVIAPELGQSSDDEEQSSLLKQAETALELAAALSTQGAVRFATYVNSAIIANNSQHTSPTPTEQGSEQEIERRVKQLCQRLAIPKTWYQLTQLTVRYHDECHHALNLDNPHLLALLENTDAFRRPGRFANFLTVCEADFGVRNVQGNKKVTRVSKNHPQADRLRQALDVTMAVSVEPLIEKGLRGPQIKAALAVLRVEALDRALGVDLHPVIGLAASD